MTTRLEACAAELANNYVEGYAGNPVHILTRHFGDVEAKLAAIETMCLRHNNSSVTTGVQLFAGKVLKVVNGTNTEVRDA